MKASELREQTGEEILQTLRETTRELQDLRARKGVGDTSEQPLKERTLRRNLAKIKTVLHERGVK